jgi:hypothetical protein
MNDAIDDILFNKDGTALAIKHFSDTFTNLITLIDNETLERQTLFASTKQPCAIFPNNSNFIMYTTYNTQLNQFIFKIITHKGIELYKKKLPIKDIQDEYSYKISNNNQYIAINFSDQQKFDLLGIDPYLNIKKETFSGKCDHINDNGSFYMHTPHTIDLYDPTTKGYTTVQHAPNKIITAVRLVPNKNLIIYCYHEDCKEKRKAYRKLLDKELHNNIKRAVEKVTPLQYMFIKKICDEPRKHNKPMYIQQNSLDPHILQSFGEHEKLITKTLKLRITDK